MSDEIEKAARKWFAKAWGDDLEVYDAEMVQSLTAFVRSQVEPAALRCEQLDAECERLADRLNRYETQLNEAQERIRALEAELKNHQAAIMTCSGSCHFALENLEARTKEQKP